MKNLSTGKKRIKNIKLFIANTKSSFLYLIAVLNIFSMCSIVTHSQETMFIDHGVESGLQGKMIYRQLGVSWADFNKDGLVDLFIATTPENQLFQNMGNNIFVDIAKSAGVNDPNGEGSTGVWGDFDSDNDLDLFVGNLQSVTMGGPEATMNGIQNRLFRNEGDGSFVDVAQQAGVSGLIEGVTGGTTSASWADYDRDGHIDLLVCNRIFGVFLYRNLGNGTFVNVTLEAGLKLGSTNTMGMIQSKSVEHGAWSDYDRDGDLDLFLSMGMPMMPTVSTNSGMDDGTMAKITKQEMTTPISSNHLFRNEGNGTFKDVTEEAGLIYESNQAVTHSAVWGDYDNDGFPDLFSGNRGSITMNTTAPSHLYHNEGNGTFRDVTVEAGIEEEISVFGATWSDFNNDGYLDLFIAIHPSMTDYPDHHINPTRFPHPLYQSNGDGTFRNINKDFLDLEMITGITDLGHLGGAAWADSDDDGDLDLIIVEAMGLGPLRFYENSNAAIGNHWIELTLSSDSSNGNCIGSLIEVISGETVITREVGFNATGWGSQGPFTQLIGIGNLEQVAVKVHWPDGSSEMFKELQSDQHHYLVQSEPTSGIDHWVHY